MQQESNLGLPSAQQVWSHATNSRTKLLAALDDDPVSRGNALVSAIEADILLGTLLVDNESRNRDEKYQAHDEIVPIMAHPPCRSSDLSAQEFLTRIMSSRLQQHVKLDFKEIEALEPTLKVLQEIGDSSDQTSRTRTIFLNADILPGPGMRQPTSIVPLDAFLERSLKFISSIQSNRISGGQLLYKVAFSLGFKVCYAEGDHYRPEDCKAMMNLVQKYKVSEKAGTSKGHYNQLMPYHSTYSFLFLF